ncbi:rod shape-determining protein MreC [Desulfovibrio sp. OttesenSCG-928-C06]|nr:rod shape-determining protein MreC [Desulfovibrio sp. OttesenSCG-928-C06]
MTGLEVTRHILAPGVWLKDQLSSFWSDYIALTGVASENVRLREEIGRLRQESDLLREDIKELERLRALAGIPGTMPWEQSGARVIAGKFGPQAALNSVIVNTGFLGGATPGAPVVTREGLVGKVLHAAPNSANVLLLNDPSFRVAVLGQDSRVRGILAGTGAGLPLEVLYVAPNSYMREGEILICSGIDGSAPKGVPAARVVSVHYDQDTLFPQIIAEPIALKSAIEEVILLIPPKGTKAENLNFNPYPEALPADESITDEEAARTMSN